MADYRETEVKRESRRTAADGTEDEPSFTEGQASSSSESTASLRTDFSDLGDGNAGHVAARRRRTLTSSLNRTASDSQLVSLHSDGSTPSGNNLQWL
jgi:hypothetical protein